MENEFHAWLQKHAPRRDELLVPVGDDAAVVEFPAGQQMVIAADTILDGVHFRLEEHGARAAGRKSLAVNLSDLAAMAARPLTATVALALPRSGAEATAHEVLEGVFALAEQFDLSVCGGDTNCWDHPLAISVTVVGVAPFDAVWRRSGGQVGDSLVTTGPLGGSLVGRHLSFTPRVRESLRWRETFAIHAAIDISDGLALDGARLAEASGCGAALRLDDIPTTIDARLRAVETGRSPIEHALSDGEDFELLLAMADDQAVRFCQENAPAKIVGQLVAESGLWSIGDGMRKPLAADGYEHH